MSRHRFTWVRSLLRRRPSRAERGAIHNFRGALERERLRADRFGHALSVLTFTLSPPADSRLAFAALEQVLRERLRATDAWGLLKTDQIAVMLPETGPVWAWAVAGDVLRAYPNGLPIPHCEVHAYPTRPPAPRRPASGATDSDRPAATRRFVVVGRDTHPVMRLEELFARPLPWWKRAIDVTVAGIVLALAAPLLFAAPLAIWLEDGPPIVSYRVRRGLAGRRFLACGFRCHAGTSGADDLTHVGRVLRASGLDHLPLVWNVLRGDLSIVGPRSLAEDVKCEAWKLRRLDVTPGLTGPWVEGGGSSDAPADRVRRELRYVGRRSLLGDLGWLLRSVPAVVHRLGTR